VREPAEGYVPSEFEREVLAEIIDDVRLGIRAFGDDSVGVCRGTHGCDSFLGLHAGELPAGEYVLQAVVRVPNAGAPGSWTLRLTTECENTTWSADGSKVTVTDVDERGLTAQYAGMSRGFPLRPLAVIHSPLTDATSRCTWTLASTHPGTPSSWSGSWEVPRARSAESDGG